MSKIDAGDGIVEVPALIHDRSAALHIPENVVPSVADLTREETQCIGSRFPSISREKHARGRAPQIGPIALSFQAEHKVGSLPTITNLATNHATAGVTARIGANTVDDVHRGEFDTPIAPGISAVRADIEAAPVVDRSHHRRWWWRLDRHIGSRRRRRHPQRNQANASKQKHLHRIFSILVPR